MAIKHALTRKSYWRLSRTPAMRIAMPNKWLHDQGLGSLKQLWCDLAPLRGTACIYNTGRTRMSGGVGRVTGDGDPYPISASLGFEVVRVDSFDCIRLRSANPDIIVNQ